MKVTPLRRGCAAESSPESSTTLRESLPATWHSHLDTIILSSEELLSLSITLDLAEFSASAQEELAVEVELDASGWIKHILSLTLSEYWKIATVYTSLASP